MFSIGNKKMRYFSEKSGFETRTPKKLRSKGWMARRSQAFTPAGKSSSYYKKKSSLEFSAFRCRNGRVQEASVTPAFPLESRDFTEGKMARK